MINLIEAFPQLPQPTGSGSDMAQYQAQNLALQEFFDLIDVIALLESMIPPTTGWVDQWQSARCSIPGLAFSFSSYRPATFLLQTERRCYELRKQLRKKEIDRAKTLHKVFHRLAMAMMEFGSHKKPRRCSNSVNREVLGPHHRKTTWASDILLTNHGYD